MSGETRSKKSSYALGPGSPRPAASQSCSAPYHLSYPPFALRAGPHRHVASHGDERAEMAGPRAQAGGPTRWVRHRGNLPGPLHAAALHPRLVANPVPGLVLVSAASMRLPELRMRPSYSASSRRADRQRRWPLSSSPRGVHTRPRGGTGDRPFARRASRASSRASKYRERCMTAGVFEVGETQSRSTVGISQAL